MPIWLKKYKKDIDLRHHCVLTSFPTTIEELNVDEVSLSDPETRIKNFGNSFYSEQRELATDFSEESKACQSKGSNIQMQIFRTTEDNAHIKKTGQ